MAGQPRQIRGTAAALLAVTLTACAPPATTPASAPAPVSSYSAGVLPAATQAWYRDAAARGARVLRIDPAASLIQATVRRGGPLARLGHDHVVASHTLDGLVAPGLQQADFGFRLDQLVVDETALRKEAGLDTEPSADAIAGTRANMLTRVLDAERFPLVLLHVERAGQAWTLRVTLHGVTRTIAVAPAIAITGAGGAVTASGAFTLRQSDFGITPLSVLGGAMTVEDVMELRYTIVAR